MLFNSSSYAVFLPIVFALYWIIPQKYRWVVLLLSSYYFYMSWNPKYVVLILGTTIISYLAALAIEKTDSQKKKKIILFFAAVICLGVLFVFKYFNFVTDSFCAFCGLFAIKLNPVTLKLLLPVGISFYTFQTLSYVIDVYRGTVKAEKHFGYYATFISFFPQLVAGPIERTNNLLPQIKSEKQFNYEQGTYGLRQMLFGFFKKIVVADSLAVFVDRVYDNLTGYSGFSLVLVSFFFAIQIYCDFSGYSDIAIGSAKLFGINLMTNFKSPYLSVSVKEFWSRWHISLSTWFRDYIYIPIGGNRVSPLRHKFNLLITFLISGLWHGASWNFVIWGGIHGIAQMFGKKKSDSALPVRIIKTICTFAFVCLAWIFFRAQTLKDAIYVFAHMFSGIGGFVTYLHSGFTDIECFMSTFVMLLLAIVIVFLADLWQLKTDIYAKIAEKPVAVRWALYLIIAVIIIFVIPTAKETQFMYFQF